MLLASPLRLTLLTAPALEGKAARLAHLLATQDVLLHGTSGHDVERFVPRAQTDFDGSHTEAVFATDDPIWPIFFAVVNRDVVRSLVNGCFHLRGERRYFFSVSADPRASGTWRDGWVYVLPRAPFQRHPSGPEWLSPVAVEPLERIHVTPRDFPFLADVVAHTPGESLPRVVARATILRKWAR